MRVKSFGPYLVVLTLMLIVLPSCVLSSKNNPAEPGPIVEGDVLSYDVRLVSLVDPDVREIGAINEGVSIEPGFARIRGNVIDGLWPAITLVDANGVFALTDFELEFDIRFPKTQSDKDALAGLVLVRPDKSKNNLLFAIRPEPKASPWNTQAIQVVDWGGEGITQNKMIVCELVEWIWYRFKLRMQNGVGKLFLDGVELTVYHYEDIQKLNPMQIRKGVAEVQIVEGEAVEVPAEDGDVQFFFYSNDIEMDIRRLKLTEL